MEEEKEQDQNQLTLKVNQSTREEILVNQLNKTQQIKKLKLSIKYQNELTHIFNLMKEFLIKQTGCTSIEIKLKSIKNFNFEKIMQPFNSLPCLTDLVIRIQEQIYFSPHQQHSINNWLSNLFSLQYLKLVINCKFLKTSDKLFALSEVYKKNPNLTKIEFTFSEVEEESNIFDYAMEGLRNLTLLESLSIIFSKSNKRVNTLINSLEYELKDHPCLNSLTICFEQGIKINERNLNYLGQILQTLNKLEKLKLFVYCSSNGFQKDNIGLKDTIKLIPNLKNLQLQLIGQYNFCIIDLIESISSVSTLDSVILELSINENEQYSRDIILFGTSLAKILQLNELKIEFGYSTRITMKDIIQLIGMLNELKVLKRLFIQSHILYNFSRNYDDIDFQNFFAVVNNLNKFYLIIDEAVNNFFANKILEIVHSSNSLQDIFLQINDYRFSSHDNQKQLLLYNLFENKQNINTIHLQLGNEYSIKQGSFYTMFSGLHKQSFLKSFSLEYKMQYEYDYDFFKLIGDSFSQFQQLTRLKLLFGEKNKIDDEGFNYFCESLKKLQNLEYFNIEIVKDNISMDTLINFISSFQYLQRVKNFNLTIHGGNFENNDEQKFGMNFTLPPKVKYINLQINQQLTYGNIENIFKEISLKQNLNNLHLKFSKLKATNADYISLKQCLLNLKFLNNLTLIPFDMRSLFLFILFEETQCVKYIDFGTSYKIFQKVYAVKNLKYISKKDQYSGQKQELEQDLYFEQFTMKIIYGSFMDDETNQQDNFDSLSFGFQNLIPLSNFQLTFTYLNKFNIKACAELFKNIGYLINLQKLILKIKQKNYFGNEGLILVGETIIKLPLLKKLSLEIDRENQIDWDNCEFSQYIGKLKQLKKLEIYINFESSRSSFLLSLLSNIKTLKNLQTLQFQFGRLLISKNDLMEFQLMFEGICEKLRVLQILIEKPSLEDEKILLKSILQLKNLQLLVIYKTRYNSLIKLKRLIKCYQIEYGGINY